MGNSVQQTSDGGYIITGTGSFVNGPTKPILIKTDGEGNEQWSQTFGNTLNAEGNSGQKTSDGGYIIAGNKPSFENGGSDVYLIKTDGNGNEQWSQTLGGTSSEKGTSVQQTSDGGYIIAGWLIQNWQPDVDVITEVFLIKTDGEGNEQWSQTFGETGDEGGYSVQQTLDEGYIITGQTNVNGNFEVYLIKTDSEGNVETTSTIELPTSTSKRELIKKINILGQENTTIKNQPMIEIYDDGSTEKKIVLKK